MLVGVVNYGMGNLFSVKSALEMIGANVIICQTPESLKKVDRIILPGVGGFEDCMENIINSGFKEGLNKEVLEQGKPIYGICLGMQIMGRMSYEFGEHKGLGWIDADVVKIKPNIESLNIPHVGWNNVVYKSDSLLFSELPKSPDFYFVHSFHLKCDKPNEVEATCDYGGIITASIKKNNIFATQFHPEKSQDYGLKLLKNFLSWKP